MQESNRFQGWVYVIYTLVLAIVFALHPMHAYDTWWHLASGQWILNHGSIPSTDPFSYTAFGNTWINHEWGTGVLFWIIFSQFRSTGLILLVTLIYWLVFFFSGRSIQILSRSKRIPFFSLFLLGSLVVHRIMVRPHIFTALFFALLFYFLYRYRDDCAAFRKKLWLLCPLFLLWANLHAGVVFGVAMLGLFWVGRFVQHLWVNRKIVWDTHLLLVLIACSVVILANPYFYQIYTFPLQHLSFHNIMMVTAEWMSPFAAGPARLLVFQGYYMLLVLTALTLIFVRKRLTLDLIVLGILPFYLSIKANRHTDLFAIWAIPFVWGQIGMLVHEKLVAFMALRGRILSIGLPFVLILAYVYRGGIPYTWDGGTDPIGFGIRAQTSPLEGVLFLEQNGIKTKIFNNVGNGGFLMLFGHPVFIDGRTPVYGDKFFGEQLASLQNPVIFEGLYNKWGFGVAFLSAEDDIDAHQLHSYLIHSPDWVLVYVDEAVYIYLDKRAEHLPIIEKNRVTDSNVMRYLKWKVKQEEEKKK